MKIKYQINNSEYGVHFLNNNLNEISRDLQKLKSDKKLLFLFDKNISKNNIDSVNKVLKDSNCIVHKLEFQGSKKNKSLEAVLKIIDFMISKGFTRKSVILSMGGGVLGDLSALAASLYMRGMIYFHIPTTITSIVDSCIGGKTAVNYQGIINSIGTYFHPNAVYILDHVIKNLPDREFYSGIPEILKCGLIKDKSIINLLDGNSNKIKNKNIIRKLCEKSLKTKIFFFKNDVHEKNQRLILNFGHTFAHSIEMAVAKNYKSNKEILRHGEAVGIGMLCELRYAANQSSNNIIQTTEKILKEYGLPVNLKFLKINKSKLQNDIFKYIFLDKKRINKYPRYISIQSIGRPKIKEMDNYNKINSIIKNIL